MRIVEQTGDRLVLAGVVGGVGWMLFALLFGALATALSIGFAIYEAQQGNWIALGWLSVGLLLGQLFFWLGLLQLAKGRERLTLDRAAGTGRYEITSPLISIETRPFAFKLEDVDGVALDMRIERAPGGPDAHRDAASETEVWRVRLRTTKPRRAIVLDETNNRRLERVRTIGLTVAEFLGADFVDVTAADGAEERSSAATARTPLAGRGGPASIDELELPEQAEPAAWSVEIDPEGKRIVFTRLARGGPVVLGCFLIMLTFFSLIAGLMGVMVWVNPATTSGGVVPLWERVATSAGAGVFLFIVAWTWLSLLRGRRQVVVSPESVRSIWLYPGRRLVAAVPGVSRLLARGESVATGEVTNVKQVGGANGRALEVRAGAVSLRVQSNADDEKKERAELKWLGASIRSAVRLLGAAAVREDG